MLAVEIDEQNYQHDKEKQEKIQVCLVYILKFWRLISCLHKAIENNWGAELKAFEQKVKLECEGQEKTIQELKR